MCMNVGTFTVLDDAGWKYSCRIFQMSPNGGSGGGGAETLHSVSLRPVTAAAKTVTELSQQSINIPNLQDDGGN